MKVGAVSGDLVVTLIVGAAAGLALVYAVRKAGDAAAAIAAPLDAAKRWIGETAQSVAALPDAGQKPEAAMHGLRRARARAGLSCRRDALT